MSNDSGDFFECMEVYKRSKIARYPTKKRVWYYDTDAYLGKKKGILRKIKSYYNWYLAQSADFYFVSYVKSGRTWARYFLASYFSYMRSVPVRTSLISEHTHDPYIFFTHHPAFSLKGKKVIFLTRDPRDLVVSRYFQLLNKKLGFHVSLSEFIRSNVFGITLVIDHMNEWYKKREELEDFFLIRYEHMDFRDLLYFICGEIDEEAYEFARDYSSFDSMKELEQSGSRDRLGTGKVREGKCGAYSGHLSADDLAYVNREMERLNPVFGYEI